MQLNEIYAIVTGGASGLGLAVARRIVAAGGRATLLDVNKAQGLTAAATLGPSAAFIATDVTDESAANGAIDCAAERMGGLTAAVNCAGIATPERLVGRQGTMAGSFFRKMIEVNLLGTAFVATAAAAVMQRNALNSAGERGRHRHDGLRGRIRRSDRASGVFGPGIFATPMMKSMPQEARDSLGKQTPFPQRHSHAATLTGGRR